ncbi:TPA: hypothetical protein ACH3X1_014603 [Trebouxia sp. C0004]
MGQTAADQLRQIIVPDLMQLVGDVKVHRVSVEAVLAYLRRQQLLFDEQLLRNMFAEADFKNEGSLATGPLTGALQGRFPKRKHGQADWLALVSVILRRPLKELQDLLAPVPSKSVTFAISKSMDTSMAATGQPMSVLKSEQHNSAFVKKAPSEEWQTLIRATSQLQSHGTGNLAVMTDRATPADPAQVSVTTARACTAVSASPSATAVRQDQLAEDMEATAMSIDTPSYARSLGMGQPGSSTGFAGAIFHPSQDLAQSMSIDGAQAMQFWDGAASLNPGSERAGFMSMTQPGHMQAAPSLMMTTSGLKSLDEIHEEQQINEDLR